MISLANIRLACATSAASIAAHASLCPLSLCDAEKAEQAQQHPGTKTTINLAEDNRKKQCKPNEPKPYSVTINPGKRHNNPTHC